MSQSAVAELEPLSEGSLQLPEFSLNIMNETGHIQTIWDPAISAEVDAARAQFDTFKKKGYVAYRVKPDGGEGEIMRDFDPAARAVIMRPAVVGG